MNHAEVRSRIADYLEGDLALSERALFDGHLDGCEPCSREVTELRETIQLLRSLPDPEPPAMLAENVIRRIRSGEGSVRVSDHLRAGLAFLARPAIALPATALAAVLLLATGRFGAWPLPVGAGAAPRDLPQLARWVSDRFPALHWDGGEADPRSSAVPSRSRLAIAPHGERVGSPVVADGLEAIRRREVTAGQGLAIHVAGPPPLVARPPRVTIQLPLAGSRLEGGPRRVVSRWPSRPVSAPTGPFVSRVASGPEPVAGLVVPASGVEAASHGLALGSLDRVAEREQRKRAELEGRLDQMIRQPVAYSRRFASLTTIEQEIWLRALADFALQTKRADEAIAQLLAAARPVTLELATAFEAELRRARSGGRPEVATAAERR